MSFTKSSRSIFPAGYIYGGGVEHIEARLLAYALHYPQDFGNILKINESIHFTFTPYHIIFDAMKKAYKEYSYFDYFTVLPYCERYIFNYYDDFYPMAEFVDACLIKLRDTDIDPSTIPYLHYAKILTKLRAEWEAVEQWTHST